MMRRRRRWRKKRKPRIDCRKTEAGAKTLQEKQFLIGETPKKMGIFAWQPVGSEICDWSASNANTKGWSHHSSQIFLGCA